MISKWLGLAILFGGGCGDDAVHHLADAPPPHVDAAVDAAVDAPGIDALLACTADAQCASGACHEETGACIDESAALYVVATGGDDTGTCTRATPCATIAYAGSIATADRAFVVLAPGTYAGFDRGGATVPIVLSGPTRAAAVATTIDDGTASSFAGAGDEYEGIEVTTTAPVFGIESNVGVLTLERVVVHDLPYICLYAHGPGSLHVEDVSLVNCANIALEAQSGDVHASRLLVLGAGIGVQLAGSADTITNSIIEAGSAAIDAEGPTAAVIDFSTLVGTNDTIFDDGVAPTITSSIVVGPATGVTASYSLFTVTPPSGTGNVMATPVFADAANHDYHLADGSPGIDAADPAATLATDIDGDARPRGPRRDMGADEHQ